MTECRRCRVVFRLSLIAADKKSGRQVTRVYISLPMACRYKKNEFGFQDSAFFPRCCFFQTASVKNLSERIEIGNIAGGCRAPRSMGSS